MSKILGTAVLFLGLSGCQTYKYAHQVKLVSFSDDFSKTESVGNVRGEDCQSLILNYPTGPHPTLDRAFESVQNQSESKNRIRYINDVSTQDKGFDALVYKKQCLVITGRGYK